MVKEITNETIASFEKDFKDNKAMQIAANAAQENGFLNRNRHWQGCRPKAVWPLLDVLSFEHHAPLNSKEVRHQGL